MVAIFTGLGAGFERGSGAALGANGLLGSSSLGRAGEGVFLNAATGNVLLTQQDEFLVGKGPDVAISRTYNSLGALDENGDHWRQSTDLRIISLSGASDAIGATVTRVSADGSENVYTNISGATRVFENLEQPGVRDQLTFDAAADNGDGRWTWRNGETQITEVYASDNLGNWRIVSRADADGNSLTYSYNTSNQLTTITTSDGGYSEYVWSGANITEIKTVTDGQPQTRTRYEYDAQNRLEKVIVDLSPKDNLISDNNVYATTYTYVDATKRIQSITQTDGSRLSIGYVDERAVEFRQLVLNDDGQGNLVERVTTIDYQADHTEITDPRGQVTMLHYDDQGQLTKIVSPDLQETLFGYAEASGAAGAHHSGFEVEGDGDWSQWKEDSNGNWYQIAWSITEGDIGGRNAIMATTTEGFIKEDKWNDPGAVQLLAGDRPDGLFSVLPGQRVGYSFSGHALKTSNAVLGGIQFIKADGGSIEWDSSAQTLIEASGWTQVSGIYEVPEGAVAAKVIAGPKTTRQKVVSDQSNNLNDTSTGIAIADFQFFRLSSNEEIRAESTDLVDETASFSASGGDVVNFDQTTSSLPNTSDWTIIDDAGEAAVKIEKADVSGDYTERGINFGTGWAEPGYVKLKIGASLSHTSGASSDLSGRQYTYGFDVKALGASNNFVVKFEYRDQNNKVLKSDNLVHSRPGNPTDPSDPHYNDWFSVSGTDVAPEGTESVSILVSAKAYYELGEWPNQDLNVGALIKNYSLYETPPGVGRLPVTAVASENLFTSAANPDLDFTVDDGGGLDSLIKLNLINPITNKVVRSFSQEDTLLETEAPLGVYNLQAAYLGNENGYTIESSTDGGQTWRAQNGALLGDNQYDALGVKLPKKGTVQTVAVRVLDASNQELVSRTFQIDHQGTPSAYSAIKLWSVDGSDVPTDSGVFSTVESSHFYEDSDGNKFVFVSNVTPDTGVNQYATDGFITKVSLNADGTATDSDVTLNWVTGLLNPKGMAAADGKLYIADDKELVVVNIADGAIDARHSIGFTRGTLNDVTTVTRADGSQEVYVSNIDNGQIWRLSNDGAGNDVFEMFFSDSSRLWGVNGIRADGERLIAGDHYNGNLYSIDLTTKEATPFLSGIPQFDGIEKLAPDKWVLTSFSGVVYIYDETQNKLSVALDSTGDIFAADIGLDSGNRTLYVPTWNKGGVGKGQVIAYQLFLGDEAPPTDPFEIEAESIISSGFVVENQGVASNGQVASLFNSGASSGELAYSFVHAAAVYDLSVIAHDESDGVSTVEVLVNGSVAQTFKLNGSYPADSVSDTNRVSLDVTGLNLSPNDTVAVRAQQGGGEWVRIDKLVFTPVGEIAPSAPPTGTIANVSVTVDAPYVIDLDDHFNDVNGDTLSYTISGPGTAHASLDGSILTINASAAGNFDLTVKANDGSHAPVSVTFTYTATAGTVGPIEVEAENAIATGYIVENWGFASNGKVASLFNSGATEGELSYVFNHDPATYDFSVIAHDENDGIGTVEVFINDVIVETFTLDGNYPSSSVADNNRVSLDVAGLTLNNGDVVKVRGANGGGEWVRIDKLVFTPITSSVSNPDAPIAVTDSYAATAGATLTINAAQGVLANDSDPQGGTLSASIVSIASHGTATLNSDGSFNYVPDANFTGFDSFTYEISDGTNVSAVTTVNITVNAAGTSHVHLHLINPNSDTHIRELSDVDTVTADDITGVYNLEATYDGDANNDGQVDSVGSVQFYLDGALWKTENNAPYTPVGDNGGDFVSAALPADGTIQQIEVRVFSGSGGGGNELGSRFFNVTYDATPNAGNGAPAAQEVDVPATNWSGRSHSQ